MKKCMLWALAVLLLAVTSGAPRAQERSSRSYTRADFVNIEGGALTDRVERAFRQFKGANQGDSLWIAYHFPARAGVNVGPFAGMIYYDDGIKLERKEDPAAAAVFLLTDASGAQARIARVKMLDLSESYVFEKRPVYWLGDVDAAQSIAFLESLMRSAPEGAEMKPMGDLAGGALRAISSHDSPRVITLLRELALKDANAAVQAAAVSSLSRIRTDQGADALVALYDAVQGDALKTEVIRGLARTDNRKAAEKLLLIAKNDPNPKLRQQAVRRLAQNRTDAIWVN